MEVSEHYLKILFANVKTGLVSCSIKEIFQLSDWKYFESGIDLNKDTNLNLEKPNEDCANWASIVITHRNLMMHKVEQVLIKNCNIWYIGFLSFPSKIRFKVP